MFAQERLFSRVLLTGCVILMLGAMAGIVAAQSSDSLELTETYVTEDGTFQLRYPSEWALTEGGNGEIELSGAGADITIYPPLWIQTASLLMGDFADSAGLLEAFSSPMVNAGLMEIQPTEKVRLSTGIAARADFVLSNVEAENSPVQFYLVAPIDDHYAMIQVFGDDEEMLTSTATAIAESLVVFADAMPTPVPMNVEVIRQQQATELSETHVTTDEAFQFSYANDWTVDDRPDGALDLGGPNGIMTIYPPNYLVTDQLFPADLSSAGTLMDSFKAAGAGSGTLEFQPSTKVQLENGVTAVRSDFVFTEDPSNMVLDQFMLAVPADNKLVLVLVSGDPSGELTDLAYAMATSFVVLNDAVPTPRPVTQASPDIIIPLPWSEAVEAMQAHGLIGQEGELLWENAFVTTALGGPTYLPDESESTYPNAAGGALLSFRPDDPNYICGILARTIGTSQPEQALLVGVDSANYLLLVDLDNNREDSPTVTDMQTGVDFYGPQQINFVLRDNRVTVWVNGVLTLEDVPVQLPEPNARGEAVPSYSGALLQNSCVMTDAWVYGFAD
ncbi:MAG: hypothetical protein U0452_04400 [Anaerolineae bacterium]